MIRPLAVRRLDCGGRLPQAAHCAGALGAAGRKRNAQRLSELAARLPAETGVQAGAPAADLNDKASLAKVVFAQRYLGVDHTEDLVMIQITLNEGRNTAQKQALFRTIAEGIHEATGLRRGDVFINLVEVKRENWSFGDGVA